MSFDFSKFNHEEGEAWGAGAAELAPGEYNVTVSKTEMPADKPGVLYVTYTAIGPEEAAGRTLRERFTLDAALARTSQKGEEVSLKRLRGLLQTAKAPKNSPPPAWVGLCLAISVESDGEYSRVKRYMPTIGKPAGALAASVPAGHTGADDEIPF
jgi:hypothetical protein